MKITINIHTFLHRVELYISKGWDKNITTPEDTCNTTNASKHPRDNLQLPPGGWNIIEKGDTSSLVFCHGHMITYFADRQTCDSIPASDVKSINENAYALSERGHIQKVEMTIDPQSIYVRSICLPEMHKDHMYLQSERSP